MGDGFVPHPGTPPARPAEHPGTLCEREQGKGHMPTLVTGRWHPPPPVTPVPDATQSPLTPTAAGEIVRRVIPGVTVTDAITRTGGQLSTVAEIRFAEPIAPDIAKIYARQWRWKQEKASHVYRLPAQHGVGPVPTARSKHSTASMPRIPGTTTPTTAAGTCAGCPSASTVRWMSAPAAAKGRAATRPDAMTAPARPAGMAFAGIARQARRTLPGARLRRHLFWRYSLVWTNPSAPAGSRREGPVRCAGPSARGE
jgi:hypothetical protein